LALTSKHLVLRASRLKNVKWIYGAVVYTGVDTKVMMNSDIGKNKVTKVEREMNRFIMLVLAI
jgi:magnesium-transporting ATPase (P-type)